jgi:lysozyme
MLYGLDCSHHQGPIAWDRVAADGITFAVLKFTQGVSYGWTEEWLRPNLTGAQRAGLLTGGYLFLQAASTGDAQGGYYVDRAAAVGGLGAAHVVDCETAPGPEFPTAQHVDAAARRIKAEIPAAKVGLYTGPWYWGERGVIGNPAVPDAIDYVWESRYVLGAEPWRTLAAGVPPSWFGAQRVDGRRSDLLQVSSTAQVAGVAGSVDLDAYPGTRAQFAALTGIQQEDDMPTIDELNDAAKAGRLDELARRMMVFVRDQANLATAQQAVSLGAGIGQIRTTVAVLAASVDQLATQPPNLALTDADRLTLAAAATVLNALAAQPTP